MNDADSHGACRRTAPKPWIFRPFLEGSSSSVLCTKNVDGFEPLPRTRNVSVQALVSSHSSSLTLTITSSISCRLYVHVVEHLFC